MPSPEACPDAEVLSAFAAGSLPTDRIDRIADHLEGCPRCQVRLEAFDRETASVVVALRRDPAPTEPIDAEAPERREWTKVGDGPREEVRKLLRRRLLVVGVVAVATAAVICLGGVSGTDDTVSAASYRHGALILLGGYGAFAAVATAHVKRRPGMSLPALRRIEQAQLAWCAAFAAYFRWTSLSGGVGRPFANDEHRTLFVEQAVLLGNLTWYLLIIGYGLLIPNTLRRSAAVAGTLAAAALGSLLLTGLALDYMKDRLPMLMGVTTIGVFMTGAFAVFGSYRISTLQEQVFEAKRLGPYSLLRKLGSGGMGEVHLAEHRLLKRPCAVKLILAEKARNPEMLRRFEREARATARLTHPNTVEVFDFGRTEEGTFYYVMEYLDGPTLTELVEKHGPLPPARVVHYLRQLCGALREAHATGLVHRDIKPGNVMVCAVGGRRDVVKLLDFGLVRPAEEDAGLTGDGVAIGTPEFMSPEQASSGPTDARSDVYSLGALAYHLVAGRPPFRTGSVLETLIAHRQQPPASLSDFVAGTPADFESIVLRCLEKAPVRRFQNVSDLHDALSACGCADEWTEAKAEAWWSQRETGV